MDYMSLIKPYVENQSAPKTTEKHLTEFVEYYESTSAEQADDVYFSEYAERLKARYKESTISRKIIPECKKFMRWCEAQKGEDKMTAEHAEELNDMAVNEDVNDNPENKSGQQDMHKGRKLKGNEARTQKVSIYMPPSLYAELNDLAHFGRKSVGDILISLTEEYVRQNARKLEIFHRAIQEANEAE